MIRRVIGLIYNRQLPLSRDQLMMLMVATNEVFLGIDIYLAHSTSGTIVPDEWIPIIFGPIAGVLLLLAGLIALRRRSPATILATIICVISIFVGLLGTYFHLRRAMRPLAPIGERISIDLLVWAPPVLAPLMFCLVGLLGIIAVAVERPEGSGTLWLTGALPFHLPFSKTRLYLMLVGLSMLATVISSVLDHARTDFSNPWLWVPTIAGIFATVVTLAVALMENPLPGDIFVYILTMVLLLVVGPLGSTLHAAYDLTAQAVIVPERFIRGAPFLAPLLYANVGLLGLIALLSPHESTPAQPGG